MLQQVIPSFSPNCTDSAELMRRRGAVKKSTDCLYSCVTSLHKSIACPYICIAYVQFLEYFSSNLLINLLKSSLSCSYFECSIVILPPPSTSYVCFSCQMAMCITSLHLTHPFVHSYPLYYSIISIWSLDYQRQGIKTCGKIQTEIDDKVKYRDEEFRDFCLIAGAMEKFLEKTQASSHNVLSLH